MEVLFDRVAGLDIGKDSVTVCVRTPGARGRRHAETRTFRGMSRSLEVMRDWLLGESVTIAAMESTSTYWKPPFYCLEDVMEVWLLNAAHMKAVPGRKTDVKDAEWIAQLLEHGLLRPSFVPPPDIRRLRMLTRYRQQLMGDRIREMTRLELMLEDASIKLSAVVSSLKTVSARAMLTAMIDGETDPRVLANMAKGRLRTKIPDLVEALTGHFDAHHAQLARSILHRLDLVEAALAELDAVIADACRPWARQIELLQTIPGVGEKIAQTFTADAPARTRHAGRTVYFCSDRCREEFVLNPGAYAADTMPTDAAPTETGSADAEHRQHGERGSRSVTDPVCGMAVHPEQAAAPAEHDGGVYWFCSTGCREAFTGAPDRDTDARSTP